MYWDTFHAMTVHCSHYYYNMTHLKLQRVQDSAYWWQFLLCIVNISGIVSHEIPKYTISNTIYFDWRSRSFGFRSVFKQYFDDWLVSFKQQDGNFFSKTEKKFISQQTRKGPYIYDAHIEVEWIGGS